MVSRSSKVLCIVINLNNVADVRVTLTCLESIVLLLEKTEELAFQITRVQIKIDIDKFFEILLFKLPEFY